MSSIQGEPAGHSARRVEIVHETGVLVQGHLLGAGGFPPDRVDPDADLVPAGQRAGRPADIRRQGQLGDGQVRLPGIAHVTRHVRQAHPLAPVPFVRIDTRVEASGEEFGKARPQGFDAVLGQHALKHKEPIFVEAFDFSRADRGKLWNVLGHDVFSMLKFDAIRTSTE